MRRIESTSRPGSVEVTIYRDIQSLFYLIRRSVDENGILEGVRLEFVKDARHRRFSLKEHPNDFVLKASDMEGTPLTIDNVVGPLPHSMSLPDVLPINHPNLGYVWLLDTKSHYQVEKQAIGFGKFL